MSVVYSPWKMWRDAYNKSTTRRPDQYFHSLFQNTSPFPTVKEQSLATDLIIAEVSYRVTLTLQSFTKLFDFCCKLIKKRQQSIANSLGTSDAYHMNVNSLCHCVCTYARVLMCS